jgi:hypothetical protein
MALINCTLSGNSGGESGCGFEYWTLINCIEWANTPEQPCLGDASHCLTDQDPLFVTDGVFDFTRWKTVKIGTVECRLPDFILEAPDHHLQPGSPAVDAGTVKGAPTTDIEGNGRPCGSGVDIGAYEFGQCPASFPKFKRGDPNSDNQVNIADAVHTLSHLFRHEPAATCLDTADANDDGKMDIADAIAVLSHLFAHTGPLPEPFGSCGIDPTIDDLNCASYTPCN